MKIDINNQSQVKNLDNKLTLISYLINRGITIPHYCYHNDLSVAGNCRVCLIELKNSPKPVVSCGISAKSCLLNNKVYYDSVLLKKARENILEFLLLNHPVDCPICDQGGECDLQEQSLFFGFTKKRFYKFKRVVSDKDLGPVVKTVMTRCIHCTRCVRFATEIAGVEDLGIFSRGVGSEIGTYVDKIFLSELSGNVVDLCPVGALTLKNFPFVLRKWDVTTYSSIDPTDSFGQETKVYVNKNQIIKIEPQFSNTSSYTWLTDKGRQFFDSMFSNNIEKNTQLENFSTKTTKQWKILFNTITENFYVFNLCNFKNANKQYFIILFENVSIETLNLLFLISQINPFIKIKRAENLKINSNLESNFQINSATEKSKLSFSSLCLLIGINTRYESSYLNLKLRQRYFKGNFKLLSIGSLIDLTFPTSFLGSNMSTLKSMVEGNQIFCKEILNSKNPILITNTETFKRNEVQKFLSIVKTFKHTNILNKIWNGYNVLNSSFYETGMHFLTPFSFLTFKDLLSFNSLYMINTNLNSVANLKKLTESKLLYYKNSRKLYNKNLLINQSLDSQLMTNNFLKFKKYLYLPNNIFFENQETFINTEGFIKRTTKIIFRKKTKNDWKLLRKFIKSFQFKNNIIDKKLIFCNNINTSSLKIFINFQFYATQTLTNLNFYLSKKNQKFSIYKKFNVFKKRPIKLFNTKLNYWLNDFYTGGKENFCQNSLSLVRCSTNLKRSSFFQIFFEESTIKILFLTEFNYFDSVLIVVVLGIAYILYMKCLKGCLDLSRANLRHKLRGPSCKFPNSNNYFKFQKREGKEVVNMQREISHNLSDFFLFDPLRRWFPNFPWGDRILKTTKPNIITQHFPKIKQRITLGSINKTTEYSTRSRAFVTNAYKECCKSKCEHVLRQVRSETWSFDISPLVSEWALRSLFGAGFLGFLFKDYLETEYNNALHPMLKNKLSILEQTRLYATEEIPNFLEVEYQKWLESEGLIDPKTYQISDEELKKMSQELFQQIETDAEKGLSMCSICDLCFDDSDIVKFRDSNSEAGSNSSILDSAIEDPLANPDAGLLDDGSKKSIKDSSNLVSDVIGPFDFQKKKKSKLKDSSDIFSGLIESFDFENKKKK